MKTRPSLAPARQNDSTNLLSCGQQTAKMNESPSVQLVSVTQVRLQVKMASFHFPLTFAARHGVVPVPAHSVEAGERRLPQQCVSWQALERDGHPNPQVAANHQAVAERSWVWAPLQLVSYDPGNRRRSRATESNAAAHG